MVAFAGPGAQPVQVTALHQQVGQMPGGGLVAGIGAGAQLVQVTALGQQVGYAPGCVVGRLRRPGRADPSRSPRLASSPASW